MQSKDSMQKDTCQALENDDKEKIIFDWAALKVKIIHWREMNRQKY